MTLQTQIDSQLAEIQASGNYRCRERHPEQAQSLISFCSNDYLSIRREPAIIDAYIKGFEKYDAGSGGSMLLGGYQSIHRELEAAFTDFLQVESALLFNSGYTANLAITAFLKALKADCLIDKKIHASFYDGFHQAESAYRRFHHQDVAHLAKQLQNKGSETVILTESVFSMGGKLSDLQSIAALAEKYHASMIVDEAHAFGLYGREGRGLIDSYSLDERRVPLRVIPLGKALAGQGAIIAGKSSWLDLLLQYARPYIYSTGMRPALAYGLYHSLQFIRKADDRREKLAALIQKFKGMAANSRLNWQDSDSAIQHLNLGSAEKALFMADALKAEGLYCPAVRSPTVPAKEAGLRVVLNYDHEPEDLHKLIKQTEAIDDAYSL